MNTNKNLTPEQAKRFALVYADIENDEPVCLTSRYAEGLYSFVMCTLYMRCEFYVDAANGEVLGISTEPIPYTEALKLCGGEDAFPSVA